MNNELILKIKDVHGCREVSYQNDSQNYQCGRTAMGIWSKMSDHPLSLRFW